MAFLQVTLIQVLRHRIRGMGSPVQVFDDLDDKRRGGLISLLSILKYLWILQYTSRGT